MLQQEQSEKKERIINASIELFSKKGYNATTVSEIATASNVAKALIYYYFKSKEDILDHLVQSLLANARTITMDFIHVNVVEMINNGNLDILPDRLHFANEEAIKYFLLNAHEFYRSVLDYALKNRATIRILMHESLKGSKHQNALFQLMNFAKSSNDNPIIQTIAKADSDFVYSNDMVSFQFFFFIIPLINFVSYYDEYKLLNALSDEQMHESYLNSFQIIIDSLVSGKDILLRNKNYST
jgi:AcrR family transcriptional regulator